MKEDADKVQSVERSISLLETLADASEMGIKELGIALDLPKGTVHRLLATMKALNMVDQTSTGKYRLGFKLFELGSKMVNRLGVRKEAMPHLENLTSISGETANLAIPDRFDIIYVERIASLAPLRLGVDLGCRFPAYALALGKAIMANMEPAELNAYLLEPEFQASIKPFTDNTITNIVELHHHLEAVRKQGYAVDNEEYLRGIRCIAVPVFNYSGKVIAAIGISGATATMTSAKIQAMIPHVKDAGRNLSRNLGYSYSMK